MIDIENILIAVDGSEHSRRAVDYGIQLACKFGSKMITVIHSVEEKGLGAHASPDLYSQQHKEGRKLLDSTASEIKKCGLYVNTILAHGDPAKNITEIAKENDVDLIIMGSRGVGLVGSILLGSVSYKVTHSTPCSVLIVH